MGSIVLKEHSASHRKIKLSLYQAMGARKVVSLTHFLDNLTDGEVVSRTFRPPFYPQEDT
jgi:hypothetical protein